MQGQGQGHAAMTVSPLLGPLLKLIYKLRAYSHQPTGVLVLRQNIL